MAAKDIEAGRAHVLIRLRDQVSGALKNVERKFSAFGRGFATAGAALTTAGGGLLAFPVNMAANMEQMQISLEVMLGSADRAKTMMADLSDFAKKTPFGLQDLSSNAQLLLNYGVSADEILPSLQAIGDVSAGSADKFSRLALAFGQTQAKGRLMGGEVMQMVEAGFNPLQEISRTTGRSVAQLQEEMEAGQISAKMLADAFASASGPGGKFHKMMDRMSSSAVGMYSTLVDAISIGITPIGTAALAVLKPLMQFATTATEAFAGFMSRNKELAMAIAASLIAVTGLGAAITVVGIAAIAVGSAIGALTPIIAAISGAAAAVMTPLVGVIALVIGLGAAVVGAWAYIAFEAGVLHEAIGWLSNVFGILATTVGTTFKGVVNALSAGQYVIAARILWAGLKLAFFQGAQAIAESFTYLWNNVFTLASRFFVALGKLAWKIGQRLPSFILAGLTGNSLASAIAQVFAEVAENDFSVGKALENRVAASRDELNQLIAQSQRQQQPGQGARSAQPGNNRGPAPNHNMLPPPQFPKQHQQQQQMQMNAARARYELQMAQANAAQQRGGFVPPDLAKLQQQMRSGIGQVNSQVAATTAPNLDLSVLVRPMEATAHATNSLLKLALNHRADPIFR